MFWSKERNRAEDRVALGGVESSQYLHTDRTVGDRVQSTQRRGVMEDDVGDEGAIERTAGLQDGTAERVDQRRQRRRCRVRSRRGRRRRRPRPKNPGP